jgi:phenylalanyl-tRNA synthetase beta chain
VSVPDQRLDLRLKEDLVEEVGRLAGYHKLTPTMPVERITAPMQNKEWYLRDIVREIMLAAGFSDVYTYAFNGIGEIEVANPIAGDKRFLRNNLMAGLKIAVSENLKYESEVRIFEFGHIFGKTDNVIREESSFAGIMGFQKRKDAQMKEDFYVMKGVLETIFRALGVNDVHYEEAGGELVASIYIGKTLIGVMSVNSFEIDFSAIVERASSHINYVAPARFPSIIRDVSLFVPMNTKVGDVEAVINKAKGSLVRSLTLIDVFEQPQEGRKSFAFRMVLQSFEKTLSDEEANAVSLSIISALEEANADWLVRK